jgi:predicted AlkP superfamily pyrophosphatase or phosphodiesterase
MPRKLVLVVVDSLRTDMLERAAAEGAAPTFAALLERGELVRECVSSFPSVTPVCCSEIATGVGAERHRVSGMNWYHAVERRYVEYGSSLEATRAFGLFRTLFDTVYNMNMSHLSHEVATIFERLQDAGVRTACTPFLIYRGRTRHELGLEGVLRRVAMAASFRHAVWGPDELFYGELYASRRVPCRPTLARPGTRDEYSACVGRELVSKDLFDFLLFSLPDNDYHSHRFGPEQSLASIEHADRSLAELVEEAGGMDAFLADHALLLVADHAQTKVESAYPVSEALGEEWRVLGPNSERPEEAELAVSPSARAAAVYLLLGGRRRARAHERIRGRLLSAAGTDLVAWLAQEGKPVEASAPGVRGSAPGPSSLEAVVRSKRGELRFRPGTGVEDGRGGSWALEGELAVLDAAVRDGVLITETYPNALERLWSALRGPYAGDLIVSLEPGFECVDWGGATHVGGGSHGSLHRGDSLVPLLRVGLEPGAGDQRGPWSLRDLAPLVLGHFGLERDDQPAPTGVAAR